MRPAGPLGPSAGVPLLPPNALLRAAGCSGGSESTDRGARSCPYFALKSPKNFFAAGGYSCSGRVGFVMKVFFIVDAGILDENDASATPSGPKPLMPGLAANTSPHSCTALFAVIPPKKKASAPEALIFEPSDR